VGDEEGARWVMLLGRDDSKGSALTMISGMGWAAVAAAGGGVVIAVAARGEGGLVIAVLVG